MNILAMVQGLRQCWPGSTLGADRGANCAPNNSPTRNCGIRGRFAGNHQTSPSSPELWPQKQIRIKTHICCSRNSTHRENSANRGWQSRFISELLKPGRAAVPEQRPLPLMAASVNRRAPVSYPAAALGIVGCQVRSPKVSKLPTQSSGTIGWSGRPYAAEDQR